MTLELVKVYSLGDFQKNAHDYIGKLKASGDPAVLTVDGQAEVVVQSAEAYQKLLEDQELLESLHGISRGLEQARRGEGSSMREFVESLAAAHSISLK